MTVTRSTIAKGVGGVGIRRISDNRVLYLTINSSVTFEKTTTEGDKVQGVNSAGTTVDLDVAGSEESFELTVNSNKNTRNMLEMVMGAGFKTKASYNIPWTESQAPASGTITLSGGTPVASSLYVSYLDGEALVSTAGTPTEGQYKDEGDGTVTFNAADNGKNVVLHYKTAASDVYLQGGDDNDALGNVDAMFYQVAGTSDVSGKKMVDILWLPKCSVSGEVSMEFGSEVSEKSFVLTGLIPDTPSGFTVPYAWIRGVEIDNSNAG